MDSIKKEMEELNTRYNRLKNSIKENERLIEKNKRLIEKQTKTYAVIKHTNYDRSNNFEVITTTSDLGYAKKLAFHNAKKNLPSKEKGAHCKITTQVENKYLINLNKIFMIKNIKKTIFKTFFLIIYLF